MIYRIVACIKQVPLGDDIDFDEDTGIMRRMGTNVINAFDLRAIAMAAHIAKQHDECRTTVVTMGPPQAADALREALAMGLDEGVHLVDPILAGADSLATAHALAAWLRRAQPNLVFLGKYSLDAETAQVGPQLAELLGVAQIAGARAIRIGDGTLRAERETDAGFDEVFCELAALVTCAERLINPVKIGAAGRKHGDRKPLRSVNAAELNTDNTRLGLAGSPTRVGKVRRVAHARQPGRLIRDLEPMDAAREAVAELDRLDGEWNKPRADAVPILHRTRRGRAGRDVWVACEIDHAGRISGPTLELLSRGGSLADTTGGKLVAMLTARKSNEQFVRTLSEHSADRIVVLQLSADHAYSPDTMAAAVAPLIEEAKPALLMSPATERGRDWMPRLAARLDLGMTGDAIDIAVGEDGDVIAHKPAFGGSMVAEIHCRTQPPLVTVRPGMVGRPTRVKRTEWATVANYSRALPVPLLRKIASHVLLDDSITPLGEASIVVGVGTGIGGPEGVAVAAALAHELDAALCGTRPVCDNGWLPRQLQVGLTGKGLNVDLYIALGISGRPNHSVALKGVKHILAVNQNPEAPIFKEADICVRGDCVEVARALTSVLMTSHKARPLSN